MRLKRRRTNLSAVGLWLCGAVVSAQIAVAIHSPAAGSLSGNPLMVVAIVASVQPMQSVTASVLGASAPLSFSSTAYCDPTCHPGWVGEVPLSGVPRGPQTLTVVAQDTFGATGQAQAGFVYDQKPVLTVLQPVDNTVARPWIHLAATCTDDDPKGCASLKVSWVDGFFNVHVLAAGTSSVDAEVNLFANEGTPLILHFDAMDSANQFASETRVVPVESSPDLYEVERVGGLIYDVQPDRILFRLGADPQTSQFAIRTRATGVDEIIDAVPGRHATDGFLTPAGAILFTVPLAAGAYGEVDEWRNGGITVLGSSNFTTALRVNGDYAIWSDGTSLYRYTVSSQTKILVSTRPVGNIYNDVAANGDVVYWTNDIYQIFRYRGGVNTQLTNDANLWNTYPVTDGVNVVYRKSTPCCVAQTWGIAVHDGTTETILEAQQPLEPQPVSDYLAAGGWTGFTRNPGDGTKVFWVRSPAGIETPLTTLGTTPHGDSLSTDGQATFSIGGRRFLASPTSSPVDVASILGLPHWEGSALFLGTGRSLFRVGVPLAPASFFTLPLCRVIDTRVPAGPLGGPVLAAGVPRVFPIAGACGIPSSAKSIAANLAVTLPASDGFLKVYPGNGAPPLTSSINFAAGQTRSNNATVLLATDGSGSIGVQNLGAGTVHLILDVAGYFQ